MTTTLIIYVLLPIIGTVMLFMVIDKRMKAGVIFRMFWNAFKGVPPVREEDRIRMVGRMTIDEYNMADEPWRHFYMQSNYYDYEKVDWKKEGF